MDKKEFEKAIKEFETPAYIFDLDIPNTMTSPGCGSPISKSLTITSLMVHNEPHMVYFPVFSLRSGKNVICGFFMPISCP